MKNYMLLLTSYGKNEIQTCLNMFQMADHTIITTSDSEDFRDCSTKLSGLSTSFTITFEDDEDNSPSKLKKNKGSNMFIRRHNRTLSLPTDHDRHSSQVRLVYTAIKCNKIMGSF